MMNVMRSYSTSTLAVLSLALVCAAPFSVQANDWVSIEGKVQIADGTPICAMVLANGQYMFSCDGTGAFGLNVPLDDAGQVTLFSFADGFAPFSTTFVPDGYYSLVEMQTAASDSAEIKTYLKETICASSGNSVRILGDITEKYGTPLCALVLANGEHMFSCDESLAEFDLILPLDDLGQATLFAFADGFQPYSQTITPGCADTVDSSRDILGTYYVRDDSNSDFAILSFFADGTFFYAEDNVDTGDEFGTYEYDPSGGQLTYAVTVDRNGDGGLDDEEVPDGSTQTITADATFRGITLKESIFLERQYQSTSSIYGTWRMSEESSTLVLMEDNGQLVFVEHDSATDNGMEAGPFFFNEGAGELTFYVYVDENLEGGLIENAFIDGQAVTFPISFDGTTLTMIVDDGVVSFTRQ